MVTAPCVAVHSGVFSYAYWTPVGHHTMAQTVRDAALESRTARARLETRKKAYFRLLDQGLHLGYRRNAGSGTWMVRLYGGDGKYRIEKLGVADDWGDANGV